MVLPSQQNRHYAYRPPVCTTKRAHEQNGLLVVATPAYQTAYQSVRPGPITQVFRRPLATLCAAVKRGRILADTEEVTGSNPVSPTSNTPGQMPIWPQRSPRRASHVQDSDRGAHLVGNQKEPALGAPAGPGNPTCLTRSPSRSSRPTRLRPSSWSDGRPNGESTGPIHENSGLQ
jgi:hypothetical protein